MKNFDARAEAYQSGLDRRLTKAPENLDRFWRSAPNVRGLDVGTGKTVLACHAAAEMIRRTGRSGVVIREGDMRGFNWDLPHDAIVILDDLGNLTGQAVLENVQALVADRFARDQRTIITTNHTVDSMIDAYGMNLVDRFRIAVNLEMVGESRR